MANIAALESLFTKKGWGLCLALVIKPFISVCFFIKKKNQFFILFSYINGPRFEKQHMLVRCVLKHGC